MGIVMNSKMPKGVEHGIQGVMYVGVAGVMNSKMPKGVEHIQPKIKKCPERM